jgi:hypothetical protein
VISILEAISHSFSPLPAAPSSAQPVLVQQGLAGFALTLAAVQGLAAVSPAYTGEVKGADGVAGGSVTPVGILNLRAAQNPQAKKGLNSGPAAAANNNIVQGSISAMASQIPPHPQPSLLPSLTAAALVQNTGVAAGSVQVALLAATSDNTAPNVPASSSALEQTAGTAGVTDHSAHGVLITTGINGQARPQETPPGSSNAAVLPTTNGEASLTAALPNRAPGSQWNVSKNGLASAEPTLLAESRPPSALSVSDIQGNRSQGDGRGLGAAESMPQASAPTVSARVSPDVGAAGVFLSSTPKPSAANPEIGQAKSANAGAPDAGVQTKFSEKTGTGDSLSQIISGQLSASPILNPTAAAVQGLAMPQFAAPRVTGAVTSPTVRGAGERVGAPASILASPFSTGSNSGSGLVIGSQTPFSVFFSGPGSDTPGSGVQRPGTPGPGTESAASVLPKMMLPAIGSAIRDDHARGADGPGATSKSSSGQSRVSPAAPAQNPKDSGVGSEGASSPAGQPLHRDVEPSASNAQAAPLQAGGMQAPTPPSSSGAALPLPQPVLPADTLPKPGTLAGGAPTSPGGTVPQAAETPAAGVPGPVQLAHLISRVEQSEMRIGMNTSAFGSVEVRTVVHANDVGLVIGSEKGDLRALLANEMPVIANTLQEQNLRLHSVNFMQGFAFSNSASDGDNSQPRAFVPLRMPVNSTVAEAAVEDSIDRLPSGEFGGGRSSLSILA